MKNRKVYSFYEQHFTGVCMDYQRCETIKYQLIITPFSVGVIL